MPTSAPSIPRAQFAPRAFGHRRDRLFLMRGAMLCLEQGGHLFARLVHRGPDDVRRGAHRPSWMICSARSVSTRAIPASASAWGRPISSPSIDLERATLFAPAALQMSMTIAAGFVGGLRPMDPGPGGDGVRLEHLQIFAEMRDHMILDRRGTVARTIEVGKGVDGDRRAWPLPCRRCARPRS
jgi:hypothetical protein